MKRRKAYINLSLYIAQQISTSCARVWAVVKRAELKDNQLELAESRLFF